MSDIKSSHVSVIKPKHHRILLANGPNLNLLGLREPEIYGSITLNEIESRLNDTARENKLEIISIQSNHEGELVDAIHHHGMLADEDRLVDTIIINPGALTHTSVALRDALLAVNKPFIEVHLSNIHRREGFRQFSYFSDAAIGVICGLGHLGYDMALKYLIEQYKLLS